MTIFNTLISALQLKDFQSSNSPLMVFDCSFDLAKPSLGYEQYLESHIVGAVYANLDTDLSAKITLLPQAAVVTPYQVLHNLRHG